MITLCVTEFPSFLKIFTILPALKCFNYAYRKLYPIIKNLLPNLLNPDLAIHSGEKPQVLKAGRYSNPDCYPNNLLIDGAHAKFQNKRTTPSVILLTKIVAYLSCSAGCMHFAWTNYQK